MHRPSCRLILFASALVVGAASGAAVAGAQVLAQNLLYTSLEPCRLVDTRLAGGALAANEPRTFDVVGVEAPGSLAKQGGNAKGCPVPGFSAPIDGFPQVQAVLLNLVAVTPLGAGFLVAWSSDRSRPQTSTLNYAAGSTLANAVVVPVRQDTQGGDITVTAAVSGCDVVADVLGYFTTETNPGGFNVFLGRLAGQVNQGGWNTAVGDSALTSNTTGSLNTAFGWAAMGYMESGQGNTAVGLEALVDNLTGSRNVAIGHYAGWLSSAGDNNIYLSSEGGYFSESNTIRIGRSMPGTFNPEVHTQTFIGGINGATSSNGTAVFVNNLGQLGTATSSLRFKENVADMGEASDGLMRLRPVTFRYRAPYDDGSRLLQYGLVAEEVAEVFPELVQYDSEGSPLSVRYHFVNAMLLNEVQKQHARIEELGANLAGQQREIDELRAALSKLQAAAKP